MFRNFFKVALRNLRRNPGFSLTNLIGLAIGITCTLLILLWVRDEVSYDRFHAHYNTIYKVMANRKFNNQVMTDNAMVFPLAGVLNQGYSSIKKAVVTSYPEDHSLRYGEQLMRRQGLSVSGPFFDIFSWHFLKGQAAHALDDPYSAVITESTARALFGTEDPMGKTIRLDNERNYFVRGVLADPPGNSSLQFDYIIPYNLSDPFVQQAMGEWVNSSWNIYLQLAPGASATEVNAIVNKVMKEHAPGETISSYFLFPMKKWHLYSDFREGINVGGMIDYVKLFSVVALIILLIACINFMNLSTARSEKRAREVGVRKTLGSGKGALVAQFYAESFLLTALAFVLAIAAAWLLMGPFNHLVGKKLGLPLGEPLFWLAAFGLIVFTGAVAGSYPALYLSSFNPIRVLKGNFAVGRGSLTPRRVLVVFQFIVSITLISATLVVYAQISHVKSRHLGYNPNNLIMLQSTPVTDQHFAAIKQQLLATGMVESATRTLSPVTEAWWKSPAPDWPGKPANTNLIFTGQRSDVDFCKTIGVRMIEGHDFSGAPIDSSSVILNKTAVRLMGLKNPLGTAIRYGRSDYSVIGVMDDMVMESPYKPVDPMMLFYSGSQSNMIAIRYKPSADMKRALEATAAVFKTNNPGFPFDYQFVDEEYGKKFMTEELISRVTNIFAGLAIFICCIGLAGLASFTIEKRFREIGIRKVLGASFSQLVMLVAREFLKLVGIAFLIAVPLGWWTMHNWLQNYEYRVQLSLWMFAWVGLGILLLTMLVVGLNTLRAAGSSPVKSLRTE